MVVESGFHHSPYQNCHHQVILAKFNLKVHCLPPCESSIFHYSLANADRIQEAINNFYWESAIDADVVALSSRHSFKY